MIVEPTVTEGDNLAILYNSHDYQAGHMIQITSMLWTRTLHRSHKHMFNSFGAYFGHEATQCSHT